MGGPDSCDHDPVLAIRESQSRRPTIRRGLTAVARHNNKNGAVGCEIEHQGLGGAVVHVGRGDRRVIEEAVRLIMGAEQRLDPRP